MLFFISFKYSLITIIKSKIFIWLSLATFLISFILNLSLGLYIRISQKEMANIFILDYANVVTILVSLTVISVIFSIDFFHVQKINGIKTMEVKNGMKIWEMFFSKTLALATVLLFLSFIITTIIVLENLIIFNENIYVTKLVFVNLYLIFLVPLFLLSLNTLIISLNWNKTALIFTGIFLGLLSPFWLVNALLYDFVNYSDEHRGKNGLQGSNYKIYFNYYIDEYKKNNDIENPFFKELSKFGQEQLNTTEIISFVNKNIKLDDKLKEYYKNFIEESYFYSSGNLFYNIDLFNSLNETYLKDPEKDYVKLQYNENLINDSKPFKKLFEFDIKKTNINLFETPHGISKPASILKELKIYTSELEELFYSNSDLKIYYEDLKKVNNLILEMFWVFYFKNENFFLHNYIDRIEEEIKDFFKTPFNEIPKYQEKAQKVFEIQKNSSAKSTYQGILFYIINNYKEGSIKKNTVSTPNKHTPSPLKMVNYYTSPFLWLEHLTKYGFVPKTFGNIIGIDSTSFVHERNNMFEVDYSVFEDEEGREKFLKINTYIYRGTNTILLVFLIILYSLIILTISYIFYRLNFYK